MKKSKKKGKNKPLSEREALAYVRRKLAKATKCRTSATITKAARRPLPAAPVRTAEQDIQSYRDACRAEQVIGAIYAGDPKLREWGIASLHDEARLVQGVGEAVNRAQRTLIGDPNDPAQREMLLKAAKGWA